MQFGNAFLKLHKITRDGIPNPTVGATLVVAQNNTVTQPKKGNHKGLPLQQNHPPVFSMSRFCYF